MSQTERISEEVSIESAIERGGSSGEFFTKGWGSEEDGENSEQ